MKSNGNYQKRDESFSSILDMSVNKDLEKDNQIDQSIGGIRSSVEIMPSVNQ
jgi:hypothetical protein